MGTLWQDLRYALRTLRKSPAFTAAAVLTLALAIGANTAIFSLIDSVMLQMLPVRQPRELVQVVHPDAQPHGFEVLSQMLPNAAWEVLRDRQDTFSGIFAWSERQFDLAQGGEARNASGLFVSGDYFNTLGVRPATGRLLTTNDDFRGCPGIALLSYGFWQSQYGGDANALSRVITLDDHPFQIVGVSATGFFGVDAANKFDIAVPICAEAILDGSSSWLDQRSIYQLRIMGRLKPGLNAKQASAGLTALSPSIFAVSAPQNWTGNALQDFLAMRLVALPSPTGISWVRNNYEQSLQTLMAVVGLVLLIACSNISCLLLVRAMARKKEIAVRLAMGASRARLMRQLLTECVLLSLAGTFLGLVLARLGSIFLARAVSAPIFGGVAKVSVDPALDWRVLGFTAAVSVLTSILLGVLPSVLSTRVSLISAMKGPRAEEVEYYSRFRPARWIVAAQVGLSLVLLFVAGLCLKSFWKLANLDAGFNRKNVLLVNVNMHNANVPEAQRVVVGESILNQLRALPGVTSVSQSWMTPISRRAMARTVLPRGPNSPTGPDALVYANFVSPGFSATLGMPLLSGRDFTEGDTAQTQSVAIINQTMARKFFPGDDPIGKYFASELPGELRTESRVVGIVEDAKYLSLREGFHATAYFPAAQMTPIPEAWNFEIRAGLKASAMEKAAEAAVLSVNKAVLLQCSTLEQQVDDSIKPERLLAVLSGFFGGLAVLLAMIGLYGVLSYSVAQRMREIGIRTALGAEKWNILWLVIGQGLRLALTGVVIGAVAGLILARLLSSFSNLLYGVRTSDPVTFTAVSLVTIGVAILACSIPARRATKVDPMVALRHE
jgi:putative ABC transport system permease protein